MSFPKAAQFNDPSDEYIAAHERYRQACSVYTKIRMYTVHPSSTDEDLARHERARRVFKTECKEYALARSKFISAIRAEKQGAQQISNAELVEQFGDLSISKVLEESKKEYTLKGTDQVYLDEIRRTSAMDQETREEFIVSGLSLDAFLDKKNQNKANDPTLGDFDALPDDIVVDTEDKEKP